MIRFVACPVHHRVSVRKAADDVADLIAALADAMEPPVAMAFLAVVKSTSDAFTVQKLAAALLDDPHGEKVAEVVAKVMGEKMGAMAGPLGEAFAEAGKKAWAAIPHIKRVVLQFETGNPRAVKTAQAQAADLVTMVTQEQKEAVKVAVVDGLKAGENPIAIAREVKQSIGLTAQQEQAALNFRHWLEKGSPRVFDYRLRDARFDPSVQAAIASGKPLPADKIEQMVTRYRERALKHRSEVIGRTEAVSAAQGAQHEGYIQLIEKGAVPKAMLRRFWSPTKDERTRPLHASMPAHNAAGRMIDEPFVTEDGRTILYPGHRDADPDLTIQCRCSTFVRLSGGIWE